jgi:restriction system protein
MSRRRKTKLIDLLLPALSVSALFIYIKTKSIQTTAAIFIALFFVAVTVMVLINLKAKKKLKMSGIGIIDKMDGLQFEQYLRLLFEEHGYKATVTPSSCDYGADLVIIKDGVKTVVQAKRYKGVVGIKAIQEIIGAKNYYNANKAMVVTNSKFSPAASNLAKVGFVELIDRSELIKMLSEFNEAGAKTDPEEIRNSSAPVCDKCHAPMIKRTGKRGDFYGCKNFPRCKETRPV